MFIPLRACYHNDYGVQLEEEMKGCYNSHLSFSVALNHVQRVNSVSIVPSTARVENTENAIQEMENVYAMKVS